MHTLNILLFVVIQLTFIYFLVDVIRTGYTGWKRWKQKRDRRVIDTLWGELGMPKVPRHSVSTET